MEPFTARVWGWTRSVEAQKFGFSAAVCSRVGYILSQIRRLSNGQCWIFVKEISKFTKTCGDVGKKPRFQASNVSLNFLNALSLNFIQNSDLPRFSSYVSIMWQLFSQMFPYFATLFSICFPYFAHMLLIFCHFFQDFIVFSHAFPTCSNIFPYFPIFSHAFPMFCAWFGP